LLATASDKGTIIRLFGIPNAKKLGQFRRGSKEARICSLSFNAVSSLLCCSSETETVHIFKIDGEGRKKGGVGIVGNGNGNLGRDDASENGSESTMGSNGGGGYEAFIDDRKKSGGLR